MASPMTDPYETAERAAADLRDLTGEDNFDAVVVLGSGWGPALTALGPVFHDIDMTAVTGFIAPIAPGHAGYLRTVRIADRPVLVCCGRTHLLEGHGVDAVAHPLRTAAALGCRTAVLTNANGTFHTDWSVGDCMLIADHLNLTARSSLSGARFVDLTDCWSPRLRALAAHFDPTLRSGTYAMLPGPHYETAAEARMLAGLGADVVGMSTVLEAIAAREAGLELLGLSMVTAIEHNGEELDPDAVVAAAEAGTARIGPLIATVLDRVLRD